RPRLPAARELLSVPTRRSSDLLTAELAFGAHFAGHACHFRGEGTELVHHRIDRVLQLENLALDVDGDLARQIAGGDGGGDFGDVAHLAGEVGAHDVHRADEVFP